MSEPIDFWFSIGSTYTYLTVMRLPDVGKETGITFRWRPFDVRTIMKEMDNIPFSTKPIKAAYMGAILSGEPVVTASHGGACRHTH